MLLAPLVPSGEEIAQLEQASAMASEVTNTVLSQRLELEEKKRSVSMLQKALVSHLTLCGAFGGTDSVKLAPLETD